MKITSINSACTTGPTHVAFNTDQPLSSYAVEQLESETFGGHMTAKIDSHGHVIVGTAGLPVDSGYVTIINDWLRDIEQEESDLYQKRLAMLEGVKKRTKLPLDDTQTNPVTID